MNKTYKLCKENVLTKNLAITYGYAKKSNPYMFLSSTFTQISLIIIEQYTGVSDIVTNAAFYLASLPALAFPIIDINDEKKIKNSSSKLLKLQEELKKRNINVDFSCDVKDFAYYNNAGYVKFLDDKGEMKIENNKIFYVDSDGILSKDITEEVNRYLLPKKKSKKVKEK